MWAIFSNTFIRFIRYKFLYVILVLSLFVVGVAIFVASISLGEQERILVTILSSSIEIAALLFVFFFILFVFVRDLYSGTLLLVRSRKPSMHQFIFWSYGWYAAMLGVLYIILTIASTIVLLVYGIDLHIVYLSALFLSYIKICVVLALIMFFSSFVAPVFAALFSLSIYVISHITPFMLFYYQYLQEWSWIWLHLMRGIYTILPQFHDLSLMEFVFSPHIGSYTLQHGIISLTAALIYIWLFLFSATLLLRRRHI